MTPDQTIALAAVVVALASLYVAWRTVNLQHKHNVLSVRPVLHVSFVDYENCLRVKIVNNGHGPLFIADVQISDGNNSKSSIIKWMPQLPENLAWSKFTGDLVDRSIPAGGHLTLLEFQGSTTDADFCKSRDECRKQLANLTVIVKYSDIYKTKFSDYSESLKWFGRNV